MDIERICANLRVLPSAEELMEAERALEALEAENEKLRAELGRLQEIKDILGPDYDLDRLQVLMEADRDGLVRIARRPPLESECCGNCDHFQRIAGTARGDCAVREYIKDHWRQEDRKRGKFTPSQSRKACRQFQRRTEEDGGSDSTGCCSTANAEEISGSETECGQGVGIE